MKCIQQLQHLPISGSVDTFERSLESAQAELGLDVSQMVQVTYKSQLELSNVIGALPNILMVAFLIWAYRLSLIHI